MKKNIVFFKENALFAGPPFGPPYPDLKNTKLQLSLEKKIKVIACLDQILAHFEI